MAPGPGRGSWLAAEFTRQGVTVAIVADAVGVTRATVYRWIRGAVHPDDANAHRLAQLLNVSEVELRRRLGMWAGDNDAAVSVERARGDAVLGVLERLMRLIEAEAADVRAQLELTG